MYRTVKTSRKVPISSIRNCKIPNTAQTCKGNDFGGGTGAGRFLVKSELCVVVENQKSRRRDQTDRFKKFK